MADSTQRLIPDCRVSVDGAKLETAEDAALARVSIDLNVDLFGQCTLVFNDPKMGPAMQMSQKFQAVVGAVMLVCTIALPIAILLVMNSRRAKEAFATVSPGPVDRGARGGHQHRASGSASVIGDGVEHAAADAPALVVRMDEQRHVHRVQVVEQRVGRGGHPQHRAALVGDPQHVPLLRG